ncbi:MAG: UDP-3-O-acylglucosamine N-acyltransferase [candidate division TM6 bacterium GW2011_GWF2_28_16]|nr:MAG: UDP-3-O-acylglucosamine N-acyltransferase [candidate division TM6 bacterium GW2011_GWF2_28_16]
MQINLDLNQIKKIIGVENSDDSFLVNNIMSLENATENDAAIILDRGSESVFSSIEIEKVKNSKAGVIIAAKEVVPGKRYLIVNDSLNAFTKIIDFVTKNNKKEKALVHESVTVGAHTVINDNTQIDQDTVIDSNVFIGSGVAIGKNVKIYSGARILDGTIIGNNCIIHANAVIGSDGFSYAVTKTGAKKIPQIGIVQIGNDVEIGACTTIDRAAFDKTVIGDGCKLDNMVHIAHNVIVGPHTIILAQTGIAGSVKIGFGCQIGGQVAIKDHLTIGNGAKIVSKSGVLKDVAPHETVAGIPALPFNKWKKSSVIFALLPEYLKKFESNSKKVSLLKNLFNKFFNKN